jgi:hypothetical protein
MTDHLEDDTPTTAVKRGGSIQPQALGPQKRSNVGSSAAFSSQGQTKIFDPKTAPPISDRLKPAGSSSSTDWPIAKGEAKKRPARRGRGPGEAQGGAQTQPDAGPTDAPTTDAMPTTQTAPQLPSPHIRRQLGDATFRTQPNPCRDIREIEQEHREEQEAAANLARTQSNLASRNALDDAMGEQRRGRETTARERAPTRTERGRLSPRRQQGRREGPYSETPYVPRQRRGRGNAARTSTTSPAPDVDVGDPPAE